jgi:cyclic pyranopterin phosphate synthase
MPEEEQPWFPRDEVLSYQEMLRVIRVGAQLGLNKVRITGGEPLTRPGVSAFCAQVAAIPGIQHVGVSTNGTLLAKNEGGITIAERLARGGVKSVNLSLDSLDRDSYHRTTSRDLLPQLMRGIAAAKDAGIESMKFNCVLIRNQTERELMNLIRFADEQDALLRFIELMPVSTTDVLNDENFLAIGTVKKLIEQETGPLIPRMDFKTNGPAAYYQIPGSTQLIGFIGAMTDLHFCESCNKLRLTCDGKFRPCLGSYLEFDMREVLRSGCTDVELAAFFGNVVARKPKEHDFRNNYQPNRKMIAIGG